MTQKPRLVKRTLNTETLNTETYLQQIPDYDESGDYRGSDEKGY